MVKIKISNWWLVDSVEGITEHILLPDAGTAAEALADAKTIWDSLSAHDQKRRIEFYLVQTSTTTECEYVLDDAQRIIDLLEVI